MRLGYSGFAGICQVSGSLQTGKGYLKIKPQFKAVDKTAPNTFIFTDE